MTFGLLFTLSDGHGLVRIRFKLTWSLTYIHLLTLHK